MAACTRLPQGELGQVTSQARQAPDASQSVFAGHWLVLVQATQVWFWQIGVVPLQVAQPSPPTPQAVALVPG